MEIRRHTRANAAAHAKYLASRRIWLPLRRSVSAVSVYAT